MDQIFSCSILSNLPFHARKDCLMGGFLSTDMSQKTMGEDGGSSAAMIVGGQTKRRFSRSNDLREQLLPGSSNEITLDLIAPKLSCKDFYTLSRVSPCWQQTIQTRLVFDARVRSHFTETVIAVHKKFDEPTMLKSAIALYSMRDYSWNEVPEVPCLSGVIESQCVSLDGVYVLGGGVKGSSFTKGRSEVYVLDLAEQRQWRQCASMQEPKLRFGAGVFDGKIYVFGGFSLDELICRREVYDPKIDAWSQINPMMNEGFDHKVSTMGEGLLVGGGAYGEWAQGSSISYTALGFPTKPALYYEMYHPVKDEWSLIETFAKQDIVKRASTAEGNTPAYEDSWEAPNVYVPPGDARCGLHVDPERLVEGFHIRFLIAPWCGIAVDGEQLAIGFHMTGCSPYSSCGLGLLRNSGFTWRLARFLPSSEGLSGPFGSGKSPYNLCVVQL